MSTIYTKSLSRKTAQTIAVAVLNLSLAHSAIATTMVVEATAVFFDSFGDFVAGGDTMPGRDAVRAAGLNLVDVIHAEDETLRMAGLFGELEDLDEYVFDLVHAVNVVHSAGYDLDGVTGHGFFEGLPAVANSARDISLDPKIVLSSSAIAASSIPLEPQNTEVASLIFDLKVLFVPEADPIVLLGSLLGLWISFRCRWASGLEVES